MRKVITVVCAFLLFLSACSTSSPTGSGAADVSADEALVMDEARSTAAESVKSTALNETRDREETDIRNTDRVNVQIGKVWIIGGCLHETHAAVDIAQ